MVVVVFGFIIIVVVAVAVGRRVGCNYIRVLKGQLNVFVDMVCCFIDIVDDVVVC